MLQEIGPNGTPAGGDCRRHIPTERTRPQRLIGAARLPHPPGCQINVDVHERFRVDFGCTAALVGFYEVGLPIGFIHLTPAGPAVSRNLHTAESATHSWVDWFGRARTRGSVHHWTPHPGSEPPYTP